MTVDKLMAAIDDMIDPNIRAEGFDLLFNDKGSFFKITRGN